MKIIFHDIIDPGILSCATTAAKWALDKRRPPMGHTTWVTVWDEMSDVGRIFAVGFNKDSLAIRHYSDQHERGWRR